MENNREIDRALAYINQTLTEHEGTVLTTIQEIVIQGSIKNWKYAKMSNDCPPHYHEKYLKNVGSQLWKKLETYWGVTVKKSQIRTVIDEQLRQNPLPDLAVPTASSTLLSQRYQWHNAFKPILLRASDYHDWLPGYQEESDLEAYKQALSESFAQLRYLDRYQEVRQQWQEVRGIVHVYDWSELRHNTLTWLLNRAKNLGASKWIWLHHSELAWAKSVSGYPGADAESLEEMETLWKQVPLVCVSPLAQLELLIDLCATTLALRRFDETDRWLYEAKSISEGISANTCDRRWQRCQLDLIHYEAEYQAGSDQLAESIRLYSKAVQGAKTLKCDRAVARNLLGLAQVEMERSRIEAAKQHLDTGFVNVYRHCDRRGMGFFAKEQIRVAKATGDRQQVVQWLEVAHRQFERLGMTVQLQRTRQLL